MQKKPCKIEISNEAEDDFTNAYEFYAKKNKELADNFYRFVDQSLNKIANNPKGFQKSFKNIHRHVMKKFPFVIYYLITNTTIQVIAIFHTSRNPEIWKDRTEQ